MASKRVTPEEDYERFARNIYGIYGEDIYDIDSYNEAFDDYMGEDLQEGWDTDLRRGGFDALRKLRPSIIGEHMGGVTPQEYKEGVRPKPRSQIRKPERLDGKKREFVHVRQVYNKKTKKFKQVFAREDIIKYHVKGKPVERVVYRDRKGRFTTKITE